MEENNVSCGLCTLWLFAGENIDNLYGLNHREPTELTLTLYYLIKSKTLVIMPDINKIAF